MAKQTNIHDAIDASKAAESRTGKVGRPKSEPTRVTSVLIKRRLIRLSGGRFDAETNEISDSVYMKNAQIVEMIEAWLNTVDLDKLIKSAMNETAKRYNETGRYEPVSFKPEDAAGSEKRTSLRIKQSVFDRIEHAISRLGINKSDLVRIVLAGDYISSTFFSNNQIATEHPRMNSYSVKKAENKLL